MYRSSLPGALVTVTSTLPEALAALERVQPHVVLFNVGLEDGRLPLAKATQDRKIPTIALTARLDDGALAMLLRGHGAALVRVIDHVAVASAVDTAIKAA
jgi:CheY-like chemotaxis protein